MNTLDLQFLSTSFNTFSSISYYSSYYAFRRAAFNTFDASGLFPIYTRSSLSHVLLPPLTPTPLPSLFLYLFLHSSCTPSLTPIPLPSLPSIIHPLIPASFPLTVPPTLSYTRCVSFSSSCALSCNPSFTSFCILFQSFLLRFMWSFLHFLQHRLTVPPAPFP